MMRFTTGNLLGADAEALVNTVNTVGVMGKGIALMFKEAFPDSYADYARACDFGDIQIGHMHVFHRGGFLNPRYIINFPTKKHWRHPSKLEWISSGLRDLREVILKLGIKSIALPPLGAGNGKLDWDDVREEIETILSDLPDVDILVFEPTDRYQNVSKRSGVEKLTPARALVVELLRRYSVLGIECTLLEAQKLAWFAERIIKKLSLSNVLDLRFKQNRYGPYAYRLSHLLNSIDGSYIHCSKRIADAAPSDVIWVEYSKSDQVTAYLGSEGKEFLPALQKAEELIDGFESPLGLELLSTIDWIVNIDGVEPTLEAVRGAVHHWPGGERSASRKAKLFNDRLIELALARLKNLSSPGAALPAIGEG
jgi:O-acetyl-ADP-ribose deacetylase (regulator of RNase III)